MLISVCLCRLFFLTEFCPKLHICRNRYMGNICLKSFDFYNFQYQNVIVSFKIYVWNTEFYALYMCSSVIWLKYLNNWGTCLHTNRWIDRYKFVGPISSPSYITYIHRTKVKILFHPHEKYNRLIYVQSDLIVGIMKKKDGDLNFYFFPWNEFQLYVNC